MRWFFQFLTLPWIRLLPSVAQGPLLTPWKHPGAGRREFIVPFLLKIVYALDPGSGTFFLIPSPPSPLSPVLQIWGPDSALVPLAKCMTMVGKGPPTNTSGQRSVPGPALPAQTQQLLIAPQAVPRVTAEGHRTPSKLASVMNLVAKLGGSRVLTFDEFKAWRREKRKGEQDQPGRKPQSFGARFLEGASNTCL